MIGSAGLGFLAGLLSTLSPCVVPLLPIVFGAAAAHRLGMAALAAGLVLSFTATGLFVATIGYSLGLDTEVFRTASAILLALLGVLLLSTALQQRFALAASGLGNRLDALAARFTQAGPAGQFVVGVILGAVWSPCVGPTLGAASLLAAQGRDLAAVALVMVAFGIGATLPLLLIATLSRQALARWRGKLLAAGSAGKTAFGLASIVIGLLVLTGADHALEATLVAASPDWLTQLTTRF